LSSITLRRIVWPLPVIRALGLLKKSAALANAELGQLSRERADLIARAADEVIAGALDAEFPLVVFQTGSGTQSNMNANEVIANRANQLAGQPLGSHTPVHPNDHVNKGSIQRFPVVMHRRCRAIVHRLLPGHGLRNTLDAGRQCADVVMIGHAPPDAVPVIEPGHRRMVPDDDGLAAAPVGPHALALQHAVDAGLNAHPQFSSTAAKFIAAKTGLPFAGPRTTSRRCHHDAMAPPVRCARRVGLMKMANGSWYARPARDIGELRI
jgi:fumarate hydratase class II